MRDQRWGMVVGVAGLGATLLTAYLAIRGVRVPGYLLSLMGISGVALLIGALLMLPPVARRLPRVRVDWPARRGNSVRQLKRLRKRLRRALSDPAQKDWQDDAFRHAVSVHEDAVDAALAQYAPQYAGRWIGQARYSIASPPESQREFFVMRLTQAVALLDDVIKQMENGPALDRDRGVSRS